MVATNSETQIVNSALLKIGQPAITSLSDGSTAANHATRVYPIIRNRLLRTSRWNFSLKRAALAPEATAPAFGFTYQSPLPDDCLRVLGIFDEDEPQQNYTSSRTPFKVEGRKILSDELTLNIFYIAEITDPNQFDPIFSEALTWALAVDFGYKFTASQRLIENAQAKYEEALKDAKTNDAVEGSPEIITASEWLDSREQGVLAFRPGPIWV